MAKYKLRGDYTFFDEKNNAVRNKLRPDGSVAEAVIIDDSKTKVEGQLHKLELVKEVKVDKSCAKQGNSQQSGPLPTAGEQAPEQPAEPSEPVVESKPEEQQSGPLPTGKKGK